MITTHLRNLLTAVVCLFAGVSAQAQFAGSYEARVATTYDTKAVEFNLTEVATALGTDAAGLVAALDAWTAEESTEENMFFLVDPNDGTLSDNYTQGGKGGFWVNVNGQPQGYSEEPTEDLRWYNTIRWDADEDLFVINIGQYPDHCVADEVFTPLFILQLGEKQATFNVTITIQARPEYNLPEPATLIEKDLNIVGSTDITVEQYPRTGFDSDALTIEVADLAEKLGVEPMLIADCIDKLLYATQYNTGDVEEGGGLKKDSLTNESSAGAPGFWLRAVQNEQGEETGECSRAPYSDQDKFFIETFAFDADATAITCKLGQYPGALVGGQKWFANIYLLYADKAYRLHFNLNVLEREQGSGTEGMTKVGEAAATVELEPANDYAYKSIYPDVDAIASALGCDVSAMSMQALDETDNFAGSTANNGGYWFNEVGLVVSHGGSSYFFIEPAASMDYSDLHVGQYPGRLNIGDEYNTTLYFVNAENYYEYKVTLKIVEPKVIEDEFKEVARRTINIQQELVNSYTWSEGVDIPTDFIEEAIGSSWEVYGMALLDDEGNEPQGNAKYTKSYSIAERPGFWMNADGRSCGWNSEAVFGISAGGYESGKFNMIQYPARTNIGDVLKTKLYFVNEETAEMVTFNFNYFIVSEVKTFEEVGSADIVLPVDYNGSTVAIDLAAPAEALGVSVDDIMSEDNYWLYGMSIDGIYVTDEEGLGNNADNGLAFDYDGGYNANGSIYFVIEKNGENTDLIITANDEVEDDFSANGAFCIRVGEKQFVYNVRFVSPVIYTGISTVGSSQASDARIFDLSGRQVQKPVRGLYIQNGKKIVVK